MSCFCLIAVLSYSQRTITGNITDGATNEPLIGANVLIEGSSVGTITDIDGNFSLSVPNDATALVVTYTGYASQTMSIGDQSVVNISLGAGELLNEVIVVGYGSQKEKEVTSAVVSISEEEFNQGPISDPAQLLQGKVAGLQVYNRGGDPNTASVIRLRGISTVGANAEPLIVIDGVIGASLENVDPNDIASITTLKDGSAAAIYGSRGSSGVIIVTTKTGKKEDSGLKLSYNGQYGVSNAVNGVQVMNASEFIAAGGTDLGSTTDWIDEVTRQGTNFVNNFSGTGSTGNTNYRISANFRNNDGILQNSGFEQFNARLNLNTKALNDKLKINFTTSLTNREQQNGFYEALRYGLLYNPTAPVLGADSPFAFNGEQFGGYFESLGLFDSFNPKSIVDQNKNDAEKRELNYSGAFTYNFLDNLSGTFRAAHQSTTYNEVIYYPTTSHFRGNATSPLRKGLANFYDNLNEFKLYEGYGTYISDFGSSSLTVTAGYSYQQENFSEHFLSLGDFPDNNYNYSDNIEVSQDLNAAGQIDANSYTSPDSKIIAFFGRANLNFNDGIFVSASVRREGSTKLGEGNKWGIFPALSAGIDLSKYMNIGGLDILKLRVGYGVTGSLPSDTGLAQPIREIVNGEDGSVSTQLLRAANPDLKWEEKAETNIGIDFGSQRLSGSLDVYRRNISDFILERAVEVSDFGVDKRFENAGSLSTNGLELAVNYDAIKNSKINYNTGIVLSTYNTTLDEYVIPEEVRGNLGSPGQNSTNMILVREGEEIGQIWGPVYTGVENGSPVFEDVNGDGELVTGQEAALEDNVDFAVLGNGTPDFELGWTNNLSIGNWNVNAFFRGAFGHSLINTFRAFYEPQVATQSSYNFVNTEKAVDGLTDARFSSLYVEKADFFKLDNLTISRGFGLPSNSPFSNLNVSITGQNLFVITKYTGADPEPSLIDYGPASNGDIVDYTNGDILAPGIDRRNNYFASRTISLGLSLNF